MNNPSLLTLSAIVSCVFIISQCINKETTDAEVIVNPKGEQFAGSESCANCHKNIYEDHLQTAHYLTSRPAIEKYIKGSFEPGKNEYAYNYSVRVAIEKRNDGFFQVEYFRTQEKKARRMDIVIGSGTKGQTYLNWRDENLFQLPITYFTAANAWSNSPGFPDKVLFNRVITSRCLECHTSFMQSTGEPDKMPEKFDHNKILYGVDCEKCHGPAKKHVDYQTQNPKLATSNFIINPGKLSRQQNLDLCASCHGGRLEKTQPSFHFTVGDKLSDYFKVDTAKPDPVKIDVHGNQYGLLRSSKCFTMSETLTCGTCHNNHQNEKGNIAVFSQRCMSCHNNEHEKTCKLRKTLGNVIEKNCVDCHMPVKESKAIAVQLKGGTAPIAALIRSHFITVYPDETKKVLNKFRGNK